MRSALKNQGEEIDKLKERYLQYSSNCLEKDTLLYPLKSKTIQI